MTRLRLLRPHSTTEIAALAFAFLLSISTVAWAQFETRSDSRVSGRAVSIAVGDFNGDGYQDMAIADTLYVWIYLGNGNGTFQKPRRYVVGVSPQAIAAGHVTSDGVLDLVVADYLGDGLYILRGNGDGTFHVASVPINKGSFPVFVGLADVNGDHKPDLLVLDNFFVSILLNTGNGTFSPSIDTLMPIGPHGAAMGDFDGDGKLDVAVAGYYAASNEVSILLGNGDGTFRQGSSYFPGLQPISVAVSDFRGSGKLDLAVGSAGGIQVLLGNGDGTFQQPVSYQSGSPKNVLVADVNGDGKPDLVAAVDFINNNPLLSGGAVLLGNGDGTFQNVTNYFSGLPTWVAAVGEMNGDKQPDLILGTDYGISAAEVLLNTGVVSFLPTTPLTFAPQLIGSTSTTQTVTLQNTGRTKLTISGISVHGQFTMSSTCGGSVAPGRHCGITAAYIPTQRGPTSGSITIKDSASSKPQAIELIGSGTVVEFSPNQLTFPAQRVGTQSHPQQVLLTNTGTTVLTLSQITLGGYNWQEFSETNDCDSRIDPGLSCTITVIFAPRKIGLGVAEVDVSDDGGGGTQLISLSGTGK